MPKSNDRMVRVNTLLFQEITGLLARLEKKEGEIITITRVETSKSLREAKVFFTAIPVGKRGRIKEMLQKKAYEWQEILGGKLDIKYTPKLKFIFDKGHQNAIMVEEILKEGKQDV